MAGKGFWICLLSLQWADFVFQAACGFAKFPDEIFAKYPDVDEVRGVAETRVQTHQMDRQTNGHYPITGGIVANASNTLYAMGVCGLLLGERDGLAAPIGKNDQQHSVNHAHLAHRMLHS